MTNLEFNQRSPESDRSQWVTIGKIVAPQGLKGEMRVYPDSDFPERFEQPGQRWLLRPGSTEPEAVELTQGHHLHGKGMYIIRLAEINSRDQVEAIRGALLLVPQSDRPALAENEFYVLDLIGAEVFNQQTQTTVGTVISVVPAGNDLLEVKLHASTAAPALIPLVREIVPVVDLESKRVEINPPPGLLPEPEQD